MKKKLLIGLLSTAFVATSAVAFSACEKPHKHSFEKWTMFTADDVLCENRLYFRTCSDCGGIEWKQGAEADHAWDIVTIAPTCEEQGYDTKTCTICGKVTIDNYTNAAGHAWEEEYSIDIAFHWIDCAECDEIKDKAEHVFVVNHDGNNHWEECVCGEKQNVIAHLFEPKKDENSHWEECACGEKKNATAHSFEVKKDENNHWAECACGEKKNVTAHSFEVKKDENNHWEECVCGEKQNVIAHLFEPKKDENSHWEECACGEKKNATAHSFEVKKDENNHWEECACGETKNVENHVFDSAGECVCGEVKESNEDENSDISQYLKYTLNEDEQSYSVGFFSGMEEVGEMLNGLNFQTVDELVNYLVENYPQLIFKGTLTIPSEYNNLPVTAISDGGFFCVSFNSVIIPSSITSIGDHAFYGCSSLTSVEIGDSVTTIGSFAFENCSSLTSVVIGDSVTTIGEDAFFYCENLTSVEIGDSVTTIGDLAFYGCNKLAEVVNKSPYITVEKGSSDNGYIGYYALAVYNSGDTFTESKLSNDNGYIVYTDGVEKILVGYNGTETDLVLPSYITKINQYAFENCSSLTSVEIGDSVTSIGQGAFEYCESLTSVVIGDSVTTIGNYAFRGCSSLTSVVIPDSVTTIDYYAFSDCYKLVEVVNKSPYITVEEGSSDNGCVGGYALAVYNNGDTFTGSKLSNDNGYIVYTDGTEKILVGYNGTETDLVLPSYITVINQYAFENFDSLTSVVIPDSVTTIGSFAFENCSSLTSVVIGDSVTTIGDYAFYCCRRLSSVVIGDSVTTIGNYTFYYTSLTSVYYKGTAEEWLKISIGSLNSNLTNATRYYYSESKPTTNGNYWHYDENGNPVVW